MSLEHTLGTNAQQMASFLEDLMSKEEGKSNHLQQHNFSWWKIITEGLLVEEGTIAATQGGSSPIARAKALVDSMPAEGGDPEAIKKVQDAHEDMHKFKGKNPSGSDMYLTTCNSRLN
jgi:hypothetical protein